MTRLIVGGCFTIICTEYRFMSSSSSDTQNDKDKDQHRTKTE